MQLLNRFPKKPTRTNKALVLAPVLWQSFGVNTLSYPTNKRQDDSYNGICTDNV
jgi:hypothetical protein